MMIKLIVPLELEKIGSSVQRLKIEPLRLKDVTCNVFCVKETAPVTASILSLALSIYRLTVNESPTLNCPVLGKKYTLAACTEDGTITKKDILIKIKGNK